MRPEKAKVKNSQDWAKIRKVLGRNPTTEEEEAIGDEIHTTKKTYEDNVDLEGEDLQDTIDCGVAKARKWARNIPDHKR